MAKLCGVEARAISTRILDVLDAPEGGTKQLPKGLETLQGGTSGVELNGSQRRLVPAKVAARIVEYYAYESKAKNETALWATKSN